MMSPSEANNFMREHIAILDANLQRFTGRYLMDSNVQRESLAKAVFEAPFAVVSHNHDSDPVFNYANRMAMALFEVNWQDLINMPSRLSAEAENRDERTKLLEKVTKHDFIDDYSGVRISAKGKCFRIDHAVVWNLYHDDVYYGQAAMFSQWKML